MKNHRVKDGECLSSIAFEHGFFHQTLWEHPKNEKLRSEHHSPHMLRPDSVVHIPELRLKAQSCATEARHRFRRKGVPETLNLRFVDGSVPRAGIPYVIVIDGVSSRGQTDEDGWLRHVLAPNAKSGTLTLHPSTDVEERYSLMLRRMPPVDELGGVQARLKNLGFYQGEVDGELGPPTVAAMQAFQASVDLALTEEPDPSTRDALVEAHGS